MTDHAKSEVLAVCTVRRARGVIESPAWWIILACGHWRKWTGEKRPDTRTKFQCPQCNTEELP